MSQKLKLIHAFEAFYQKLNNNAFGVLYEEPIVYDEKKLKLLSVDIKAHINSQKKDLKVKDEKNQSKKVKPVSVRVYDENVIDLIHKSKGNQKTEDEKSEAVLVFCSSKNPGGGVFDGASAQEEDIARHTSWLMHAQKAKEFYNQKHQSALNQDAVMFVKNGWALKDPYGVLCEPFRISFIGACSPNLRGLKDQKSSVSEDVVYQTLKERIEHVLHVASIHKIDRLILGAWGCGVFGLDPKKVAAAFLDVLTVGRFEGECVFAITSKEQAAVFNEVLEPLIELELKSSVELKEVREPKGANCKIKGFKS